MKNRLVISCLFVFFAAVFPLAAQETFAPLIGESTIGFLHLDLRNVEIDKLKENILAASDQSLKHYGFDDKSVRSISREVKKELDKAVEAVRPHFEKIVGEFGIDELACLVDVKLLENNVGFIMAVPWKNKTPEDLHSFLDYLEKFDVDLATEEIEDKEILITAHDLLILALPAGHFAPEDVRDVAKDWADTFQAGTELPIHEALKSVGDKELKIVAATPPGAEKMVAAIDFPPDAAPIKAMLTLASKKLRWAGTGFSWTDTSNVRLTLEAGKPADAKQLLNMLEGTIDWGMFAFQTAVNIENAQSENGLNVPPVTFEVMKGIFRMFLPRQEGSQLIFEYKGDQSSLTAAYATNGVLVALLLPAVQAAR
ncbi:MAG TPA: hypothetical protein DEB39_06530, partial [Planctomycetaceae bacterium]|nr:hypothetical protein [Planctomycetaceae bacterium]